MQVGDPFNPRFEECHFHPEEVVSRRRDLTSGQKLLYQHMVHWARRTAGDRSNERAGEVWRAHETIAAELGRSARQIARDFARLEAVRLMAHRVRDGRKSNTYIFLWHSDFDHATTAARQGERTGIGRQALTGHERQSNANLTGHLRHPNQEEINQKLESLTHQGHGRLLEREQPGTRTEARGSQTLLSVSKGPFHPGFRGWKTWPTGGWSSEADFEAWWRDLVWKHPNRHHNSTAKAKAIQLIWNGKLTREEFDEGYSRLKASSLARWAAENGRYAPNLIRLLEDAMWKYASAEPLAVGRYENAHDYLRRVENE